MPGNSNWTILVIVGLIVLVVVASRYMWNLKQEIVQLQEQSRDFITLQMLETHIANLDRQTLQEAIRHAGASTAHAQQLQQRLNEYTKNAGASTAVPPTVDARY